MNRIQVEVYSLKVASYLINLGYTYTIKNKKTLYFDMNFEQFLQKKEYYKTSKERLILNTTVETTTEYEQKLRDIYNSLKAQFNIENKG
jgi:hypothetical protein